MEVTSRLYVCVSSGADTYKNVFMTFPKNVLKVTTNYTALSTSYHKDFGAMATHAFFNLPAAGEASHVNEKAYFGDSTKHSVQTNWRTFEDQPLSTESMTDLFANRIPVARVQEFLKPDELEKMLKVCSTHELVILGSYSIQPTRLT